MLRVADFLHERLGVEVAEVEGATFSGEVPLSDAAINRFIARRLSASHSSVENVTVEAQDNDAFVVRITMRARFVPRLTVHAQIDCQPELPRSPVLWLGISMPGMGVLGSLAAAVASQLTALPRGVRVEGSRVAVDVQEILESKDLGDLMHYVTALRISTRQGKVIVFAQAAVASR